MFDEIIGVRENRVQKSYRVVPKVDLSLSLVESIGKLKDIRVAFVSPKEYSCSKQ
jgi:hypothetical protein